MPRVPIPDREILPSPRSVKLGGDYLEATFSLRACAVGCCPPKSQPCLARSRMNPSHRHVFSGAAALALLALGLSGCATGPQPEQPAAAPEVLPTLPPAFPPQDIVGRWGLAAYHKEEDRA